MELYFDSPYTHSWRGQELYLYFAVVLVNVTVVIINKNSTNNDDNNNTATTYLKSTSGNYITSLRPKIEPAGRRL